jgi:hypothetical protein
MVLETLHLGAKCLEYEAGHLHACKENVKNAWSFSSITPYIIICCEGMGTAYFHI